MNNTVTVIIGWYGDHKFWNRHLARAFNSVMEQSVPADKVIIHRGLDLEKARNVGLTVNTEYIIFLDADDELNYFYIEAMLKGVGDIRVPAVVRINEQGVWDYGQFWYTPRNLIDGTNYIVIGALVRAELFKKVGGFRDLPCLEDYDLWLRMEESGAEIRQCPDAVYKINQRSNSRGEDQNQNRILEQIIGEAKKRRGL